MLALKARVRNGRITLDEATDLPDGTVLDLYVPDSADELDDLVELDDDEQAELRIALEEGLADIRAGRGIDGDALLAELQARG